MKVIIPLLTIAMLHSSLYAQNKWDGEAGDSLWKNPLNWTSNTAPVLAPSQDIILDNSFNANSYTVKIVNTDSVVIRSLVINPDPGKTITVLIDKSNTISIALTVSSSSQGIVLERGGIIVNASGAASGNIISLADSLRINDGGLYSHQTRRAHALLVSKLSRRAGTENGVFEFNIPSASNTLSLSNQVYGTLRLSSALFGSSLTYSGGASNPLRIRGDLEIGAGVTFSLNFSDTVLVQKRYIQNGGTLNLATATMRTVMVMNGDINQSAGSITKTGTIIPELLINGSSNQNITVNGVISGNVLVKINNAAGITLQSPVSIPYQLQLVKGRVSTSASNLLTLSSGCTMIADSLNSGSFINGPLRKEGLLLTDNFLFPVGKGSNHRWLCLKNATGNFTVEYIRSDPYTFSSAMGNGMHHISHLEYWNVTADALPSPAANIELSYDPDRSGAVTDLTTLRVANWQGSGSWENIGNISTMGTAGSKGSVVSHNYTGWLTGSLFTLGSSTAETNILPLKAKIKPTITRPEQEPPFTVKKIFPRSGYITCQVNSTVRRTVWLELVDMSGRRLRSIEQLLTAGDNLIYINNINLSSGIYLLRFFDNGRLGQLPLNYTRRFLVLQ